MSEYYILETRRDSDLGWAVDKRCLYFTYDEAEEAFNKILKDNYTTEELEDEDLTVDCMNDGAGLDDYIDYWCDEENGIFVATFGIEQD